LIHLAAFRPVKENPNREILSEVFKAMFDAGRDEQNIQRLNLLTICPANKFP
jgi:hypothetical protein